MVSPIIQGKDFNYFRKITVTNTTFPSESQVMFNFKGQCGFSIINEGSTLVEYSFNGNTLHGDLTPGSSTASLTFSNRRVPAIWFRSASSTVVRIEAWASPA